MIALGPSLCGETIRNVTVTEIREWNVTDVVTNVSSDCCLNCIHSHINVSKKDKVTIMEDIHGLVKCPSECSSYTDYIHVYNHELPTGHHFNPYPTAFPYGNGMVLHFYQQQESSTTKTVHKVINKGLKTYI